MPQRNSLVIDSQRILIVPGERKSGAPRIQDCPYADIIIIPKPDISYLSMKTLIEVHQEGNYFVAIDLLTNVADQGLFGTRGPAKLKRKVLRNITSS